MEQTSGRTLGVDAMRGGWVGAASDGRYYAAPRIEALVDAVEVDGELVCVAIDIPIGLPEAGERCADLEARRLVGKRWPSVFLTPTRAALEADAYQEANRINRELTGHGLSSQAYALRPKILEVDRWARSTPMRVVEVHPEVSFRALAGRPLAHPKSTWAGVVERHALLASASLAPSGDLGPAGAAGVDDILDATAALWSARRVVDGTALTIPEVPEPVTCGMTAAILA